MVALKRAFLVWKVDDDTVCIFHSSLQARFQKAMALTGEEFLDRLNYFNTSWWPAREIVETALNNRLEVAAPSYLITTIFHNANPSKNLTDWEHLYEQNGPTFWDTRHAKKGALWRNILSKKSVPTNFASKLNFSWLVILLLHHNAFNYTKFDHPILD